MTIHRIFKGCNLYQNLQQRRSVWITRTIDFAKIIATEDAKSVNVAKSIVIERNIEIAKSIEFVLPIKITNRCVFLYCLYFLFLVFSLHVSGLHWPIIRGISSCCLYATIWFMQCFVDRLRASADWFVVVPDARRRSTKHCMNQMVS